MSNYSLPLVFEVSGEDIKKRADKYFYLFIFGVILSLGIFIAAFFPLPKFIILGHTFFSSRFQGKVYATILMCGLFTAYTGYMRFQYFSKLYERRNTLFTANEKGIGCYLTDWTLIWNNIDSIRFMASRNAINISLHLPVMVMNEFKNKSRQRELFVETKYLEISNEAAEELIVFLKELRVKYQQTPLHN